MDKYIVRIYRNRFWQIGEIFKNGDKIADINVFYEVSKDWIIIYGTVGSSGSGHSKGDVERKIYIGDSELIVEFL